MTKRQEDHSCLWLRNTRYKTAMGPLLGLVIHRLWWQKVRRGRLKIRSLDSGLGPNDSPHPTGAPFADKYDQSVQSHVVSSCPLWQWQWRQRHAQDSRRPLHTRGEKAARFWRTFQGQELLPLAPDPLLRTGGGHGDHGAPLTGSSLVLKPDAVLVLRPRVQPVKHVPLGVPSTMRK